jgi:hypothetical protein
MVFQMNKILTVIFATLVHVSFATLLVAAEPAEPVGP